MSKLEDREYQRKSVISGMIGRQAVSEPTPAGRGRPKEDREIKKRISLSVLPSLYGDIQKIAHVQRRSVSELIAELLEEYRAAHTKELRTYGGLKNKRGS